MAFGGGTFLTKNKILPGTYVRFFSLAKASIMLSDRGVAALPLPMSWGMEGAVQEITGDMLQTESLQLFGYAYDAPELMPLREAFATGLRVLYLYRLTGETVKATCKNGAVTIGTAKHGGVRGNDLRIAIENNPDSIDDPAEGAFIVKTYIGVDLRDTQKVNTAAELADNAWVVFNKTQTLAATAAVQFTGGEDGTVTTAGHQTALDALEPYSFNTLGCASGELSVRKLYINYTKRMRTEVGAYFQLVVWRGVDDEANYTADDEGVISVENTVEGDNTWALVFWVLGAAAACAINRSNTNRMYNGELKIHTDYRQRDLERAILAGKFIFHQANGDVCVLYDCNTFRSVTDEKGDIFKNNQTIRICDQLGNDIAVAFNTRYLGKVQNDEPGRMAFWNDVCGLIRQMVELRAVENFDPESVMVAEGATKDSVDLDIDGLDIVWCMAKLYMSVWLA